MLNNIFLSLAGILIFTNLGLAFWLKHERKKNKVLNLRLTAIKGELKGLLIRSKNQAAVSKMTAEQVDLQLNEYFLE